MYRLNGRQIKAIEEISVNASAVVLGTLVLGRFITSEGFQLTGFTTGIIIYGGLVWFTIRLHHEQKGGEG